jgi:hypothetical protein
MIKKKIDIGARFGMLIILEEVDSLVAPHVGMEDRGWIRNKRMVNCLCDCGNKVIRQYNNLPKLLKSGKISSCGCYNPNKSKELQYDVRVDNMNNKEKKEYIIKLINEGYNNVQIRMVTKCSTGHISLTRKSIGKGNWIIDNNIEIGLRSHRLEILSKSNKSDAKNIYVTCKCDCGNIVDVRYDKIKKSAAISCGCYQKELAREMMLTKLLPNHIKHEDSKKNSENYYLYQIWMGIKQRCYNPNNKRYNTYGARGIKVYEPWMDDYVMFKEWVLTNLGPKPVTNSKKRGDNYSFDRINNDGNYEPGNLKWSTFKEQANNRGVRGSKNPLSVMYRGKYEKHYGLKIKEGYQIHHIDGDRTNNNLDNLIDVTSKEHGWLRRKINIHLKNKSRDEIRLVLNNLKETNPYI